MNVVLSTAESIIGRPTVVYWVDGGLPEFFSTPSLRPAVVIFSSRYLELAGTLRGLLHSGIEIGAGLLEEVSYRNGLRTVAELALQHGDPALATYLLARSLAGETYHPLSVTLEEMEQYPKNEMYMAVWFYALAHELGHVRAAGRRVEPSERECEARLKSEARLQQLVEAVIDALDYGDLYDRYLEANNGLVASSSTLDIRNLSTEVDCDLIAVQILFRACRTVIDENETASFSPSRLAAEFLTMYQVFNYMNNYATIARLATAGPELAGSIDPWIKVANLVRLNVVAEFSAFHLTTGGDPGGVDELPPAHAAELLSSMQERIATDGRRLEPFDEGDRRAAEEILYPHLQEVGIVQQLAKDLADSRGVNSRRVLVEFCELAADLGVEHPDINLLAGIAEHPKEAAAACLRNRSAYYVQFLQGDGSPRPLSIRVGDSTVVLAFISPNNALQFMQLAGGARHNSEQGLRLAQIDAYIEQDLRITIHSYLPQDERRNALVAVEGTDEFAAARERHLQLGRTGTDGHPTSP